MSGFDLPPLPPTLKSIQHYLKTAIEHDKRDPVIAYYCRLYALQNGMEVDKKSPDARKFHVALMDNLEKIKQQNTDEPIHNEVVGQAHVENYALKVFLFADNEDRAGRFNKNVVKSFYTAGMLFDTLSVFGEVSEEIDKNRKYAKWKAAYIHKCLKNGETPIAGPMPEEGEDASGGAAPIGFEQPGPPQQPGAATYQPPQPGPSTYQLNQPQPPPQASNSSYLPGADRSPGTGTHAPPSTPMEPQTNQAPATFTTGWTPPVNASGVQLKSENYQRCMKLCKFASSALQYEDSKTAIDNLTKALNILTTGKE